MEFTTRLRAAISSNPTLGTEKDTEMKVARGLTPAMGSPIQENLDKQNYIKNCPLHHNSLPEGREGFGDGLILVHSPLLKES